MRTYLIEYLYKGRTFSSVIELELITEENITLQLLKNNTELAYDFVSAKLEIISVVKA